MDTELLRRGGRPKRDRFTNGIIRTQDGYARKIVGAGALEEYTKATAVHDALRGTTFFSPLPITYDLNEGSVDFEFIEGALLLQELLESTPPEGFDDLACRNRDAAELLATLHARLVLQAAVPWDPPAELRELATGEGYDLSGKDDVFLHCDYSPVNLIVLGHEKMGVIDASPNGYFTVRASLKGHRLVDVATYTAKLMWPFRLRAYQTNWRRKVRGLREDFVAVYEDVSGVSLDRRLLVLFEEAVVRSFIEFRTRSSLLRFAARIVAFGASSRFR